MDSDTIKNSFVRLFVLFCYCYNFGIYPIPRSIRSGLLITLALIFFQFVKDRKMLYVFPLRFGQLLLILMAFIGIAICYSLAGTYAPDFGFVNPLLYTPIFLLGAYLINSIFYSHLDRYKLLEDIVFVCFIQSIIVMLMVAVPAIGNTVRFLIQNDLSNGPNLIGAGQAFRGNGISGSLFWDFGLQQSLGLILIAWLMKARKFKTVYVFYYFAILISVFLTSRTGLLGAAISLGIMAIGPSIGGSWRFPALRFWTTALIVFGCITPFINWDAVSDITNFAFELFINFIETGEFTSTSTNHLTNDMLFIPPWDVMIFGEGGFFMPSGSYYAGTDSGYLRHFYYWGIFSVFFYGIFIYIASKNIRWVSDNISKLTIFAIWSLLFIAHIKGEVFVLSYQCMTVPYLIFCYSLYHKYRNESTIYN